jgi:hypothetical protein
MATMEKIEKEELFGEMRSEIRTVMREETNRVLGVYTEQIDDKFRVVNERFDHIEGILGGHTETLKDMAVDIIAIKSDVKVINAKLDRKADVKDLATLDRRITVLENKGQ